MAIDQFTYPERVCRLAAQAGVTLSQADVWSSRNDALQAMADEVADNPRLRGYAQRAVADLAFAGGVASLEDDPDVLQQHIRKVVHTAEDGTTRTSVSMLKYGCSTKDLTYERTTLVYWGVVVAGSIYVMQGNGVDAAPDGTLSFEASVVPAFAPSGDEIAIHPQLEDVLVAKGATLAARL